MTRSKVTKTDGTEIIVTDEQAVHYARIIAQGKGKEYGIVKVDINPSRSE